MKHLWWTVPVLAWGQVAGLIPVELWGQDLGYGEHALALTILVLILVLTQRKENDSKYP